MRHGYSLRELLLSQQKGFMVSEGGGKGYTVLVVPTLLKKVGVLKGEGSHRKYTEEVFVEELRNARFQSVETSIGLVKERYELEPLFI